VEFVKAIPFELKLKGLKTKESLKQAMNGKPPRNNPAHVKEGLGIPIAEWLKRTRRGRV